MSHGPAPRHETLARRDDTIAAVALAAVGASWFAVAGLVAVVIRFGTPGPEELLRDVADRRLVWMASVVLLIVQQAALAVGMTGLVRALRTTGGPAGAAADSVGVLAAIAAGSLTASGVTHGVLGAHLASKVTPAPLADDVVLATEVVHAIADTFWFVGIAAMAAFTLILSLAWWGSPRRKLVARLGVLSAAANVLQFGWFVDHGFAVFAALGLLLQVSWFVAAGVSLQSRRAER